MEITDKCLAFGETYAAIYDKLYQAKDYAAETRFALEQFHTVIPIAPRRILDLGCGTGRHAVELAQAKIVVTGIDRSADMLAIAENRRKILPEDVRKRLEFRIGDIRTINCHRQYDAVLSLFHVISYMVEDEDLKAVFQTARRHLNSDGSFLFDFWYGPAVLRAPPQPRVKKICAGNNVIQRRAISEWDRQRHAISVNYDIEIRNVLNGKTTIVREKHIVRYYFLDEIQKHLAVSGFELTRVGELMTGNNASDDTLFVYALAKVK